MKEEKRSRLSKAIEEFLKVYRQNPDRNYLQVYEDLQEGRRPSLPPICINKGWHPSEMESLARQRSLDEKEDEFTKLAKKIEGLTAPLKIGNPFIPYLSTSFGTMTLATAFGIKILFSPDNSDGNPKQHLPLKGFDNFELPDIFKAGLIPKIKEQIDFIKENTPSEIKIGYPDMQGPFNIAHIILGTDIFYLLYDEAERIHHLLQLITNFMIELYKALPLWIGEERMFNWIGATKRIAECSCNLISKETYREFVKSYDLQLEKFHGEIAIHPCNGKHVFDVTLEELPNVRYTECGIIEKTVAGSTDIDYALNKILGRPIILSVGQELVEGREEETIREHLEKLHQHPLLTFGYTGMYWTKKDEGYIRKLNQKFYDYYLERFV